MEPSCVEVFPPLRQRASPHPTVDFKASRYWHNASGDTPSVGLTSPSPPAEKATARQNQTGQASADDGAGNGGDGGNRYRASL